MEEFISTFGGYTEIVSGTPIIEALVVSKLADSKAEAKRLLKGKTVKINNFGSQAVGDEKKLTESDCRSDDFLFLLAGKHVRLIRIAGKRMLDP